MNIWTSMASIKGDVSGKQLVSLRTILPLLLLTGACTTIPVDERAQVRAEVDQVAIDTIEQIVDRRPEFQSDLDNSAGWLVGRVSATKLPLLGGGYGLAVLFDKETGSRSYLNISRFDFGAGIGVGSYRAIAIFENREALKRVRDGTWHQGLSASSTVGSLGESAASFIGDGYSVYVISESGAELSVTVRLAKTSINQELTDTGVSELSIPNIGFDSVEGQSAGEAKIWDHKLPFLAQKVIDEGYDLPLPYGIGLTYANVDQDQILTDLRVGINGSEVIPLDWVEFSNARSESESISIKADVWLFPFMNLYAMLGKVEGQAPIDVLIDGNGFLDELGVDCNGLPPSLLCPVLQDKLITLPIRAPFEGNTYGIGTVLAGGWNGWFVTLPFNWTYADMQGSMTDGVTYTATPRFGKVINMGRNGNLALFAGGNYLNSDLTVDGLAATPGDELVFDYMIDQENKDKWNAVVGFNWDINRRLSWSAEYNGFTGSREAFISSITWKY